MSEKLTVLVVDDSRTVRAAIRSHLNGHFNVLEAEDGEAGWQALQENADVKLVISDIQMPNLDGYGFICRIRAANEESIRNNPIVVITSAEDDISRERAYACGANDFILKPLEFSNLVPRLQSQIDASISGRTHIAQDMKKYESAIEDAVLEAPDVSTALNMLKNGNSGALDPYIIDLCMEVMPLLDYVNETASVDIGKELTSIKTKLESERW